MPIVLTTEALATALESWAVEVTSTFPAPDQLHSYEHMPRSISKALPLVISEVKRDRIAIDGDATVPNVGQYQQQVARIWVIDLMMMVTPEPTWDASKLLYKYVDALGEALRRDPTLGDRVPAASPLYDASYDPPEVEHADGTVARQVTMTVIVGEPKEV